ncbi:xylan 1,4-beta-xylosidase [Streptomyces sp. AcE210]|uniref:GH39 family glycosyl hydrolase n=1 Tax=Streptomyces sp. AcE210 TaxID=2292703 RepID=UPI000E2FFAEB|nr:xylan 1,4-beta-xylosidase [Streptomyces sp. AcE210]RFC77961.1 xylan 1,4-beta-xylosidase [Streptomyces sp. AcE210]
MSTGIERPEGTDCESGTGRDPKAREDWEQRIGSQSDHRAAAPVPTLPPPTGLTLTQGAGHVLLRWQRVQGAIGYLVFRAPAGAGRDELTPVDHFGRDVLAIPDVWYVDTTGDPGVVYDYAVASVPTVTKCGEPGEVVTGGSAKAEGAVPQVELAVDATADGERLFRPWQPMIGSERLSQLLCTDTTGGKVIGTELEAALRRVHDEVGVHAVRAHSILHDDLGVYREIDGEPVYDFTLVDEVYDRIVAIGLQPCVELGFMPGDLASDPDKTVFEYRGIVSPPKNWDRWADLISALVRHLMDRYGEDVVLGWDFEVWNEANLGVFWSGTRDAWMRLYDVTATAVKAVDPRLAVGGPSSAAAGWVDEFLEHTARSGAPVDFVTTHTYGNAPLDLRPTLERYGSNARIAWTEWGVTPSHFHPVNDTVSSATFLLHGMRSAAGRLDALSYWVASDHFEELGRPPGLLHGGFGLITVGGIAKARFHALYLLSRLGDTQLPVTAQGDGADGLVQSWASRHDDGSLGILLWNHTLDQEKAEGDAALARRVELRIDGLGEGVRVRVTRLDAEHGDVTTLAARLGVGEWPTDEQWDQLRAADQLVAEPVSPEYTEDGAVLMLDLPQPSAVLVEVSV